MGYKHIENLYKNQEVLMFKECYVSEKVHGTSAHVRWDGRNIDFFSGGACNQMFSNLFDREELTQKAEGMAIPKWVIYGEAYGGKQQGMRETYGNVLKFVAFEAKLTDTWLDTYSAEKFVKSLGMEFVWYTRCTTDLVTLDKYRDQVSQQAIRNGVGDDKKSEGIVIRPLMELTKNNGSRIMAKHKAENFSETKTPRVVTNQELKVLSQIKDICIEWVTENRLSNILSHITKTLDISDIPNLIAIMTEDILREGKDEIVPSKALNKAIARETALMVKRRLQTNLRGDNYGAKS